MNESSSPLPHGQFELDEFPRFGLGKFAAALSSEELRLELTIGGDVATPFAVTRQALNALPRTEQVSDFHCVTTWSTRGLRWRGVRFADFYHRLVETEAHPHPLATTVVLRAADGYCNCLPLDDLLAGDVLLADQLNGNVLDINHGAPLRLVAPAHYGYKNVKHLTRIEFWRDRRHYQFPRPYPALMDHPRARVAHEERGLYVPAWLLRLIYKPLVRSTIRRFKRLGASRE